MNKNLTYSDWPTDDQLKSVWAKVDKMESGQFLDVSKSAPKLPDLFRQCLKMWIDCFRDGEFNSDYTIFRKTSHSNLIDTNKPRYEN